MLSLPAFIGAPGPFELVVFLTIALLLFGKRLPEIARSTGQAFNNFKKGLTEIDDETQIST